VFAPPYLHTIEATSRTFLGHTGQDPANTKSKTLYPKP